MVLKSLLQPTFLRLLIHPPKARGQSLVQTLGLLFVTLLVGGLAIDAGLFFSAQHMMQNAADGAALAGASELFKASTASLSERLSRSKAAASEIARANHGVGLGDQDIEFGFYDTVQHSFTYHPYLAPAASKPFTATGGLNAVRVVARAGRNQANKPIGTLFSRFIGINSLSTQAQAIAIYAGGVESMVGVRPIFLCERAWTEAQRRYGDPTLPEIELTGDSRELSDDGGSSNTASVPSGSTIRVGGGLLDNRTSCDPMGAGNWGLANFDNSPQMPAPETVRLWLRQGYPEPVVVDDNYTPQPATMMRRYQDSLSYLAASRSIVPVVLYESRAEEGRQFKVTGIVGFQIESARTEGPLKTIRGRFHKMLCHSDCTLPPEPKTSGGMSKIRLVK